MRKKKCSFAIIWNREGLSSGTWLFSPVFLGKAACRRHIKSFATADLECSQVLPKGPSTWQSTAVYSNSAFWSGPGAAGGTHGAPCKHTCVRNPQQIRAVPGQQFRLVQERRDVVGEQIKKMSVTTAKAGKECLLCISDVFKNNSSLWLLSWVVLWYLIFNRSAALSIKETYLKSFPYCSFLCDEKAVNLQPSSIGTTAGPSGSRTEEQPLHPVSVQQLKRAALHRKSHIRMLHCALRSIPMKHGTGVAL